MFNFLKNNLLPGQSPVNGTQLNALQLAQLGQSTGVSGSGPMGTNVGPTIPGMNPTGQPGQLGANGLGIGGMWNKIGGADGFGQIMGGIGDLAGIYTSLKGLGLAKDQLAFQRESYETNLGNQTKSYNTALGDRATARGFTQGDSLQKTQEYINKNRL